MLYTAIQHDATELALRLIREGVALDTRCGGYIDSDEGTPLWKAAERGNLPAVEALLRAGADPDARSNFGHPPISTALTDGRWSIARALLEHGCDLNAVRGDGRGGQVEGGAKPLDAALDGAASSTFERRDIMDEMLEAGAVFGSEADPVFAFHSVFTEHDGGEDVELLLRGGVDLSGAGWFEPPVRAAAEASGIPGALDRLLEIDGLPLGPLSPDDRGSALYSAYWSDNLSAAKKLLAAGASPDATSDNGHPLLSEAARGGRVGWLVLLLQAGADPDGAAGGPSPLRVAERRGDDLAVAALLAAGADPAGHD